LEGAQEDGAVADLVLLGDLTIADCDGCHTCWQGKECSKNDDMNNMYPKIIESDVIVFGTPVYWYGPTALMKAFIDRFVYFNCPANRVKIRGKSAVIAVPFEEENCEAAGGVVAFFEKSIEYLEMNLAGQILVPGVGRKGEILTKQERLKEARELGKSLAKF